MWRKGVIDKKGTYSKSIQFKKKIITGKERGKWHNLSAISNLQRKFLHFSFNERLPRQLDYVNGISKKFVFFGIPYQLSLFSAGMLSWHNLKHGHVLISLKNISTATFFCFFFCFLFLSL